MSPDILTANTMPPTEAAHLAFGGEAKQSLIEGFESLGIQASSVDNENALSDLAAIGEALGKELGPVLVCAQEMRAFEAAIMIGGLLELDSELDGWLRTTPYYETGTAHLLQGVTEGVTLTSTTENL